LSKHLSVLRRRSEARNVLDQLDGKRDQTLIIHYSCESFYDINDGRTPRITSIAVRHFASGNTDSFSIHKSAELGKIPFAEIAQNYDALEKAMLDEFFIFLGQHQNYNFVHWNMRDINYGFQAIEHRYKVLGGSPTVIHDSKKIDLPRLLVSIFGVGYASHGSSGRLHTLMALNSVKTKDVLTGAGEAKAFEEREYVKLHQSTLRKVDVIANLLGRFLDGSIKTEATWKERYGYHPVALLEYMREHWVFSLIGLLVATLSFIALFFPELVAIG
jgi:hypothetical protein